MECGSCPSEWQPCGVQVYGVELWVGVLLACAEESAIGNSNNNSITVASELSMSPECSPAPHCESFQVIEVVPKLGLGILSR